MFCCRLTSKRKSTGDGAAASCNKAQSATDETFAHKKRRRAQKQMQDMAAEKEKGTAEQQQPDGGAQKTMVLPKKRPLAGSQPTAVAAAAIVATAVTPKKQAKASGDEAVDDETLIRETEAALKSLSGGWPGPRHSFYRTGHDDDNRYESPAFVNLFDEKKIGTGTVVVGHALQAVKVDENKNTCDAKSLSQQQLQRRDLDGMLGCGNKTDQQKEMGGEHGNNNNNNNNRKPASDKYAPSKYEPDFNELVDDSSDELEIDMSADGGSAGGDKDDVDGVADRICRRKLDVDRRNNNSHMRADEMKSESDTYDAYLMDKTAFSAFRPVAGGVEPKDPTRLDLPTAVGAAMSPLGPYPPTGATFVVGYATGLPVNVSAAGGSPPAKLSPIGGGGVLQSAVPVKPVCIKLEDDGGGSTTDCNKPEAAVKMDSPSPLSKQYTILQPAGADSRAATALQDVAREGVLGASVVSAAGSSGGGNLSPRTAAGTPKLNVLDGGVLMPPGCMNSKGEFCSRTDYRNAIARQK